MIINKIFIGPIVKWDTTTAIQIIIIKYFYYYKYLYYYSLPNSSSFLVGYQYCT